MNVLSIFSPINILIEPQNLKKITYYTIVKTGNQRKWWIKELK